MAFLASYTAHVQKHSLEKIFKDKAEEKKSGSWMGGFHLKTVNKNMEINTLKHRRLQKLS